MVGAWERRPEWWWLKCSVKKIRRGAKVDVIFWIFRFVKGKDSSEEIRSFVETRCKRGCSSFDEPFSFYTLRPLRLPQWFFRLAGTGGFFFGFRIFFALIS